MKISQATLSAIIVLGSPIVVASANLRASEPAPSIEEGRNLQNNCGGDTPPAAAWHPTYSAGWTNGHCRLTVDCNSPAYSTELECCKGAYGGQMSGECLKRLPNPPTTSPTSTGGLDVYYPDYGMTWSEGKCVNTRPLPSGRPTYDSMLACCKGAYGGQMSGACLEQLPSPPTTSPTEVGGVGLWYPDYETSWADAACLNTWPAPFNTGDRPTYENQLDCCKNAYGGQTSGACLAALPSPPTTSPTAAGGLDFWYPDYGAVWSEATCKNERPLPFNVGDRPTYDTQLACCKGAYGGQLSGACIGALPSPPTTSPTAAGGLDVWYPDYSKSWAEAACKNDGPLPSGRPTYDTLLACCKGAYGGQTSGACIATLPSPPTTSPTESGNLDVYYKHPDQDSNWAGGKCTNERPVAPWRQTYGTKAECCSGQFGGQFSDACMCWADPCYSCKCTGAGSPAEAGNTCNLTCE